MDKKQILTKVEHLFEDAKENDLEVLDAVLNGLLKRGSDIPSSYISKLLNWEKKELDDGRFQITLPIEPLTLNIFNKVHGGITATLLDTTMGSLMNHRLLSKGMGVVTTEMKVNYIRPGDGNELTCIAELIHQGRKLCVIEGKVYNDNNEVIAIANGTFYIFKIS